MKHAACVSHAVAVACLVCSGLASAASSVLYQVTDLLDATPGQDLWQYRYLVSGSFSPFDELSILFDSDRVVSFVPVSTPDASWLVVAEAQPMPLVPAGGVYSVKAVAAAASVLESAPFVVDFIRKGAASPGVQAFEILDGNFNLLDSGMTSPIPEPRSYLLLAAGLIVLGVRRTMRQLL